MKTEQQREILAHEPIARNIVGRLHVSTSPRQVVKAVRSRINREQRSLPAVKWLRKGVYRLALIEHQANREEFTRVTGHIVFNRVGARYQA